MEVMKMADMRMSPKEAAESYCPPTVADAPAYPYGLCISLCSDELEKLNLDFDTLCVGDLIHLHAMAMITSKSCSERQNDEPQERVELQITNLSTEDEEDENSIAEKVMTGMTKAMKKMYKE